MKYSIRIIILTIASIFFMACKEDVEPINQNPNDSLNTQVCNGSVQLCNKTYHNVVFACTHNAYNFPTEEANFLLPNQNQSIEQQLKDGIRAFMLDLHYADEDLEASDHQEPGKVWLYHSTSIAGYVPLEKELKIFVDFLTQEPTEIITFILESYVDFKDFEKAIRNAGIDAFLYHPSVEKPWITLQEMIDRNERLVVLTDRPDEDADPWYINVWEVAFETHFSNKARRDFSCTVNRGNADNDLFIFNHFITRQFIGTGLVDSAKVINQYDYLLNRILECESEIGKIPNFITVDFYKEGDALKVVQHLNQ